MMTIQESLVFREVQRFALWLRAAIVAGALAMVALCWFVLAETASQQGAAQVFVVIFCVALMVILPVGIAVFFLMLKLETEVRRDGLYIRFFPIHIRYRRFTRADIVRHFACSYRPIRDYGGWGIRFGPQGKAYNVSGNRGVQLVFRDGKRLLIGSQKADELAEAIGAIAETSEVATNVQ